nr:serine/threonine-protein kinase [Aquimonas voraii]
MGVVYLGRREGLVDAPAVALKLIAERLRSGAAKERFLSEQRSLARLDHPGVCRFIDADTLADGRPLVVMEAVKGQPIDAWLTASKPSLRALLELLLELLAAVSHAHERLIVHRDIKASNVLVTDGGRVKLLDFGIAKLMDEAESTQATATSDRFMTPGIAAPEYWSRGEVTVATDVYALGALMYRLLSGRDPLRFEGMGPTAIERQLLFVEPDPLSAAVSPEFRSQINRDLEAIVHKCLRKSPADRYGSADALAADLRRLLDGFPVLARPSGALYRAHLFGKRHRGGLAASIMALALLAGWAISLRASLNEAERQRETAVAERNRATLVSDILQQSILQADPARRSMEFVGAREIMTAAAQRIAPLETSDPSTFADLALSISSIELEYIRNTEALELARRGLDALSGVARPEQANKLRLVAAIAAARERRLDEAEALISDYLATGAPADMALNLATSRILLGRTRYQEAFEASLAGLSHPEADDPQNHLANELRRQHAQTLLRMGRRSEALDALGAMLEWQRKSLPEAHAWVLETRMDRLPLLARDSSSSVIETERDELIASMKLLFGDPSPQVAFVHARAGEALAQLGDHAGTAMAMREASRRLRDIRGPTDDTYLRLQLNLGLALLQIGSAESLAEARQVLEAAERTQSERMGPQSAFALHFRTLLARVLARQGRGEEAVALLSGPEEAAWEVAVASSANRRARAATLRELLESSALGCRPGHASIDPRCAQLQQRLERLQQTPGI